MPSLYQVEHQPRTPIPDPTVSLAKRACKLQSQPSTLAERIDIDFARFHQVLNNFQTSIDNGRVQRWICSRVFVMDIGINMTETPVTNKDYFTQKGTIEELGDMSVFYGIEEINAEDMEVIAEKELFLGMKADLQLVKDGQVIYTIKNGNKLITSN